MYLQRNVKHYTDEVPRGGFAGKYLVIYEKAGIQKSKGLGGGRPLVPQQAPLSTQTPAIQTIRTRPVKEAMGVTYQRHRECHPASTTAQSRGGCLSEKVHQRLFFVTLT